MIERHHGWNVSYKPPVLGFILSLLITVAMYRFATKHHLTGSMLFLSIIGLGMVQAFVQLIFFLHVGMESKPHWNTISFYFTVLVVVIIIGGSIWIMNNLSYNLMPSM